MKQALAIAALVATSLGLAAAPVLAQDATATAAPALVKAERPAQRVMRHGGPIARGGNFLAFVCSDRGAEALEISLVRLSHRLDLTAEQQPLFDTFRGNVLTTQTSFADSCAAALPERSADAAPDLLARLKAGVALQEAQLAAMNAVLPDFEALYASLTDAQKASLMPRHGARQHFEHRGDRTERGDRPDRAGPGRQAPDRSSRAPAPGR